MALAVDRGSIAGYVGTLFNVYSLIILAYVISLMFFGFGGRIPYARWSNAILSFLRDVSEPLLRPFRQIVPRFGPIDFSPMVALIALNLVGRLVVRLIAG